MTTSTSSANPLRLWIALGVIVVAALAFAVATSGGQLATSEPISAWGTPVVEGDALPPYQAGAQDPAIGAAAPVLTDIAVDGTEYVVGAGETPQVVAFLAHWCSHCRAEVPVVVDWLEQGGLPAGVELVAVATSTDEGQPNFPPQDWLAREEWPTTILLDDQATTAAAAYGVSSFPFWVVVDGDGQVVLRVSGELVPEQLDLLAQWAVAPPE